MTRENAAIYGRRLYLDAPIADYSFNYATPMFRHPSSRLAGLCVRPASLKVRHEVSGRGGNTPIDFFFRARYNPCRCEAVIRAAVTRPWTLELHPTDETDYSSYQINLCLLSLAGLCPPSPPAPVPPRLAVASPFCPPVVSALHENSLNPDAITRTWRSARLVTQHNRCPQSVPIRIYRSSGFTVEHARSSPFATAADPPVSPLRVLL